MPISVSCSKCNRKYQIRDELAGKVAKCQCGQNLTIPEVAVPMAILDEPTVATGPPAADPFAGLPDDVASRGSTLPPLTGARKKPFKRKQVNPYLILGIAGGSVVAVLILVLAIIALSSGGSETAASLETPAPAAAAASTSNVRWATPEAVFEAQTKAFLEKDWRTVFETGSPNAQQVMTRSTVAMAVSLGQMVPEFKAICAEYELEGLNMTQQTFQGKSPAEVQRQIIAHIEKMASKVSNRPAFFARVMGTVANEKTKGPMGMNFGEASEQLKARGNAQLSDMEVSADTASGTITMTVGGHAKQETIDFVKIDGEWRIEMETPTPGDPSP